MSGTACSGTLRIPRKRAGGIRRFRRRNAIVWYCLLAIGGFFVLNGAYQVLRKPTEIFAPVSASLSKSPEATWRTYGPLFERHSTSVLSPEFLAALAQLESDGNPLARTYWRWQWSQNPFELYRPASSAVGMFQITDGTFGQARKYCIHDHQVVTEGPWYDLRSCWFNSLYARIIPSHAIEMTAAYLHRNAADTLAAGRTARAGVDQKQKLAAVIHLCGVKRGEVFVKRGFRAAPGEHCGTHSLRHYLQQVDLMKKRFAGLRTARGG